MGLRKAYIFQNRASPKEYPRHGQAYERVHVAREGGKRERGRKRGNCTRWSSLGAQRPAKAQGNKERLFQRVLSEYLVCILANASAFSIQRV